jgi:hypothetical protein
MRQLRTVRVGTVTSMTTATLSDTCRARMMGKMAQLMMTPTTKPVRTSFPSTNNQSLRTQAWLSQPPPHPGAKPSRDKSFNPIDHSDRGAESLHAPLPGSPRQERFHDVCVRPLPYLEFRFCAPSWCMMVEHVCPPALPACPMRSGTKKARSSSDSSTRSKVFMIPAVIPSEIRKNSSQPMRWEGGGRAQAHEASVPCPC